MTATEAITAGSLTRKTFNAHSAIIPDL